jgi:COG4 transport protein
LEFDLETIEGIYKETEVLEVGTPSSPIDDNGGLMGCSPVTTLNQLHGVLTTMLMDAFDDAVARDASALMIKCFKLFPKISRHSLGLDKFSAYICGIVSSHCKTAVKTSLEKSIRG